MMIAETKCKFCGAKVIARWDNDADQQAVDKFFPMLVCNPCADNHRKKIDSEHDILTACFTYARLSQSDKGKSVAVLREKLLLMTKSYAEGIAYIDKLPNAMWTEDFADMLIEKPADGGRILRNYRFKLSSAAGA